MSTTSTGDEYTFTLTTTQTASGNHDVASWNCYSSNGMSDAFASAIYEALAAVVPPTGCTLQISVSKQGISNTTYTTNTTVNPITFT